MIPAVSLITSVYGLRERRGDRVSWSRVPLRETDPYPNDARFSLKSGRFQSRDEKASARFPVLLLEVSRKKHRCWVWKETRAWIARYTSDWIEEEKVPHLRAKSDFIEYANFEKCQEPRGLSDTTCSNGKYDFSACTFWSFSDGTSVWQITGAVTFY